MQSFFDFSGGKLVTKSKIRVQLVCYLCFIQGLGESTVFQKRRSKILPIAFLLATTFGLAAIVLSFAARQQQVPRFSGAHSPYAVTVTTDYVNSDYLSHLDMQTVSSKTDKKSAQKEWAFDSRVAEKAIGQKLPESIKQVKLDVSPATLVQAIKGDAEIEMTRDGDSVRFRMVKPNPYLKVD